ncbi:hypothetical protein [Nocardia sp. BMG111209]|uniref:hypothetical protein n=1 Tax=Nocardia sp. BMG111209 TaxID=1160137 RepID=UPI000380B1A2|nr:hypothetical protein [Nocardia sp. BMG111209]
MLTLLISLVAVPAAAAVAAWAVLAVRYRRRIRRQFRGLPAQVTPMRRPEDMNAASGASV